MAQTGYTPISLYYSSTAAAAPTAGNLVPGELAINTADGRLYYKDSAGVVQTLATKDSAAGSFVNLAYTGTLTGGTGVVNLGSGQFYKDASGNVGIGTSSPGFRLHNYTTSTGAISTATQNTATGTGTWVATETISNTNQTSIRAYSSSFSQFTHAGISLANWSEIWGGTYAGSGPSGMLIGVDTAAPIVLATNNTERMRIDSSGNVGIGTNSPTRRLQVYQTTGDYQARLGYSDSYYYDFGRNSTNGYFNFYGNQSGAVGYIWGGVDGERMRIDSSGQVGIGVTSPNQKLEVGGTMRASRIGTPTTYMEIFGGDGSIDPRINVPSGFGIPFNVGGSEKARIDSSGNLLVGTTSAVVSNSAGFRVFPSGEFASTMAGSTNSTVTSTIYSTGAGALRFYVGLGGTVYATSTTITGISDQRVKENIVDLDDGLDAVMALKPRKFDWKAGKGKDIKGDRGFIAQEFEQVFPDMIEEWKDPAPEGEEPYKAVNANLIPTLVKAIQEQQVMIEELKAKVAALEAK